ncbi:hypothetical protein KM043_013942 [Ampulex compressa]|nr:hypothetical protein KM043_013942 [Ampulex compressa]
MATFSLNLDKKLEAGLLASGKFDGSHACLALATPAGNVLVHGPHRQPRLEISQGSKHRMAWEGELAELRIGARVTALCTGRLGDDERDILLVGTATHVLAYQVEENADIFYKEVPEGACSLLVAKLSWLPKQALIVGGDCSVTVLDSTGSELFWTVVDGAVTALTVADFDDDGENELLIGTEEYGIKAYKGDTILWETKETAKVVALVGLSGRGSFAYAVANGTIGGYRLGQRLWCVKSKYRVVSLRCFDVNADGTPELVTGWNNGKVDARCCATGKVIFKVHLSTTLAGIVEADYRRIGKPDLLAVSINGEVRGYGPGSSLSLVEPGEPTRELLSKKQALLMELRQRAASVPSTYHGTRLAVGLASERGAARIALAAGPGLLVHCAIAFAEGVFEGETLVSHPIRPRAELEIELRPQSNGPIDVHVKVCVGPAGADLLQVYEMSQQLPRFCMYELVPQSDAPAMKRSGLTLELSERPQRIALWLNQSFILPKEARIPEDGSRAGRLELYLRGMRDEKIHRLEVEATTGRFTLETEDWEFAGEVVQSLTAYLGLGELSCEADFPLEEARLMEALARVGELREIEAKLQAEAAGQAATLKNMAIRFEDARILGDIEEAKKRLMQLRTANSDLMIEHEISRRSYEELASHLKELNLGVQRAARLRVGKAAASTISRCRKAIQDENPKALALAVRHG